MDLDKKYTAYIRTLSKIGLTRIDTVIYITLLQHAGLSPSEISQKTQLFRPSIYTSLERLQDVGLIHISSKGKRVVYAAESPEKLESVFKKVEKDFFSEIEDLHTLYNNSKNKMYVSMSSGAEAIRELYLNIVTETEKNGTYYRYSATDKKHIRDKYRPKGYETIRDKKQLERLIITGENRHTRKYLGRTVKFVPERYNLFQDSVNVIIHNDKVSVVDYNSESTITITHKKFAEFQKKIFKILFDRL